MSGGAGLATAQETLDRAAVVALDVVGTIVEPSEPIAATYVRIAADFGRPHDPTVTAERFAAAMKRIWSEGTTDTDERLERDRWFRTVAATLPDAADRNQAIFDALWEHFAAAEAWTWHDDAQRFVARLTQLGIPWGLASNFDSRLHRWAATQPELNAARFVVTSAELGVLKRDPRFYQRLSERIDRELQEGRGGCAFRGALAEGGCRLMIGDQPANDIDPSRSAGWQAIWLCRPGTQHAVLPSPVAPTIARFDELRLA